MKEDDYILATDLSKLRIAQHCLNDTMLMALYDSEARTAYSHLRKLIGRLEKRYADSLEQDEEQE